MQNTMIIFQLPEGQKFPSFGEVRGDVFGRTEGGFFGTNGDVFGTKRGFFGRIKGCLLLTCLLLTGMVVPGFAQKNLLEGSWKLDSVSVVKSSDNSAVEISQVKQNPYFGLFDGLIFQGEELTVIENGNSTKGTVQLFNEKISFHFMPAPIEVEYRIKDEQLFLEQRVSYPGKGHPNNEIYIVYAKYIKQ